MGKRLAIAVLGVVVGGLVGWIIATLVGWPFATIVGLIAGGIGAVTWAERQHRIPSVEELERPRPISLTDPRDRP